jgi:hypothetical protein
LNTLSLLAALEAVALEPALMVAQAVVPVDFAQARVYL